MKMNGEQVIPAPRQRVWEALNDPEVLKQAIPGCNEMVKHSPTEFTAKVMAKVGPVKANFSGDVTLSKLNPPESYLISGQGTGGAAGFAEGGAEVRLEEVDGKTRLVYDVDAKVGGKLAQIGSRLIDSTARRMADDFFKRFSEVVTSGEAAAAGQQADAVAETAETAETPPAKAPAKKPTAKKAPAKKAPAKKAAAKKTATKKSAKSKAGKAPAKSTWRGDEAAEPAEPAGADENLSPPPSLMPEATVASSASTRSEPDKPAPQSPLAGNNLWWLIGAAVVALLVILVLANV